MPIYMKNLIKMHPIAREQHECCLHNLPKILRKCCVQVFRKMHFHSNWFLSICLFTYKFYSLRYDVHTEFRLLPKLCENTQVAGYSFGQIKSKQTLAKYTKYSKSWNIFGKMAKKRTQPTQNNCVRSLLLFDVGLLFYYAFGCTEKVCSALSLSLN